MDDALSYYLNNKCSITELGDSAETGQGTIRYKMFGLIGYS